MQRKKNFFFNTNNISAFYETLNLLERHCFFSFPLTFFILNQEKSLTTKKFLKVQEGGRGQGHFQLVLNHINEGLVPSP